MSKPKFAFASRTRRLLKMGEGQQGGAERRLSNRKRAKQIAEETEEEFSRRNGVAPAPKSDEELRVEIARYAGGGQTMPVRGFVERMASMLRLDFYRLLHTPLFYIMVTIAALIPAMVLSLTGSDASAGTAAFTNAWQMLAFAEPTYVISDMGQYANINMVYIFGGITLAIFIGHDYTSGFVKSVFTSHARKVDYVLSKAVLGLFTTLCMTCTYLVGFVFAGILTGKSFEVAIGGLLCCLLSKLVLSMGFSMLYTFLAVLLRRKFGFTIVGCFVLGCGLPVMAASLATGMTSQLDVLLYGAASAACLASTPATVLMCAVVSLVWGAIYALAATLVLNLRDLA